MKDILSEKTYSTKRRFSPFFTCDKVAEKDGVLGYFDTLTPLYASFHEDDHTFSLMWTEYTDSFSHFYKTYEENRKLFGCNHGVLCQPQTDIM